ncbi:asparaginase [Tessaracoccus antarcticus]|uniref:Asparaginase n=2 Tax=Tessaracoccus antarcticus TaxID=2479848 RepID=A0A3M0GBJ6_9ACTN|nr:asparaginase [Tessaracoccus antarcticus]
MGGTIAMTPAAPNAPVRPGLDAHDLVAAAPGLADVADLWVENICNIPSPSITVAEVLSALDFARRSVAAGAVGVMLTHGTDNLEETAYLLDLLWDEEAPIVVTGAMRSAMMPGADGPANLLAAAITASSSLARGIGVLTCLNDTVHLAARVTKSSSMTMQAFESPGFSPVGRIVEGTLRRQWSPATQRPAALPVPTAGPIDVALLEAAFGEDGRLISTAHQAGYRGIVIAGSGVGHMSASAADAVSAAIADGVSVVVASRTASGGTATAIYGYPGSEADLIERGAVMAGDLSPRKARLLLHVLLSADRGADGISAEFNSRGRDCFPRA